MTYHEDSDTYIFYSEGGTVSDPTEYGFEFERMVTGTRFNLDTIGDICNYYHFHLVRLLKKYTVLMIGEVDAMHNIYNNRYVEIKSGFNIQRMGKQIVKKNLFQMITNGSSEMLYGVQSEPSCSRERRKLEMMSLSELIDLYIKFFVFDGMDYKKLEYELNHLGGFVENRLIKIQNDILHFRKETSEDGRHLQNDFLVQNGKGGDLLVDRHPQNGYILEDELNHILALIVCDAHSGN